MATHLTASREQWPEARRDLLAAEKDLTRRSDEVARLRQRLPWVRLDKGYRFETEAGARTLKELFDGRSQLIVYHFMFGPDYAAGCPSCSMIADGFDGFAVHLANHDVTLTAVSRAPLDKLLAYRKRMGWRFPWASSHGGDFNADFSVGFSEGQQRDEGIEYNFRRETPLRDRLGGPVACFAESCGVDSAAFLRERPGMSAFALEDGAVYHAYSTYARGLDGLWGAFQWLDRAPKGRNQQRPWWRRRDEYGQL